MDSGIRVAACKTGNRRLLDEIFKLKPIKRGVKSYLNSSRNHSNSKSNLSNTQCLSPPLTTTLLSQHPPPPTHTFHENLTIWTKPK